MENIDEKEVALLQKIEDKMKKNVDAYNADNHN